MFQLQKQILQTLQNMLINLKISTLSKIYELQIIHTRFH